MVQYKCDRQVRLQKIRKSGRLCWSVTLHKRHKYATKFLSRGTEAPKFFLIYFDAHHFGRAEFMFFYMQENGFDLYGPGNNFALNLRNIINTTTGEGIRNGVPLTYTTYESQLMPYPYDTNCRNYSDTN